MKSFLAILALALLGGGAVPASGQGNRRCTGEPPDSTLLRQGPVYRDCEVERPAQLRTSDYPIDFTPTGSSVPAGGCYRAGFQFVVDSAGRPELGTVSPVPGNDRGLEDAMRPGLSQLRYDSARMGGQKVRQIVVYRRAVEAIVRVNPTEEPTGLPTTRNSAGNCR